MGFLSRCCSGKGPHLALKGESPGVSRVAEEPWGSSRVATWTSNPLVLPQESQVSIRVARGLLGFLSSRCRGIGPHLELRPEPQGSSPVLTWISGFLWSFNRGVRPRLVWRHGTPLPSRGVKGVSVFLSSGHRGLGLFLKVPRGCHTSLRVLSQFSGFQSSPCKGIRLIWSGWGNQGLFELRHNSLGCARVSR